MPADLRAVETWLPGWLPDQRWFSDKARSIRSCRVVASTSVDEAIAVLLVRVAFADDGAEDYIVPVRLDPLSEALDDRRFLDWFARLLTGEGEWPGVVARTSLTGDRPDLTGLAARPLGVEQSNSSIRYGERWVAKLNRRVNYGPSPEVELSALLNRWPGDPVSPRTVASLTVTTDLGDAPLALLAEYVANSGDGWSTFLALLAEDEADGRLAPSTSAAMAEIGAVATLTADMHGALARDPWTSDLAPERIASDDVRGWMEANRSSLDESVSLLRAALPHLDERSRALADPVLADQQRIVSSLDGLRALVGSRRTRIHGDYHLGQLLRTPARRYVAIDFDGEVQRGLDERRAKYSPLRDVAGMLGSLAYAIGTVQDRLGRGADLPALAAWERAAQPRFLDAYLDRAMANRSDLLPSDPERIRQALLALRVEKAIYEIEFELNNRPTWVWIPLSVLLRLI